MRRMRRKAPVRRIVVLLMASGILGAVYLSVPAEAHTSPGLACGITSIWFEGSGHGGLRYYGVGVRLTNNRASAVKMIAGIENGLGKMLWTKRFPMNAHSSVVTSVTSHSATDWIAHCHSA
jgi:hypothetical protein